ncbi:hypothetical protein A8B78_05585 [Jannaschia sp. EhC01]|nr:hypothetical protein A8B78_05585 [Jannaschia sp. EhC01]
MLLTARADLCPSITQLALDEPARFNPECLEELCVKIGEVRAEAEVALALHRLSELLPKLEAMLRDDGAGFAVAVEQVCRDADLIGMATLARVAHSVLDSYATGNHVALAATLARMDRVGERSIHAVWDLEDLSG